MERAAGGWGGDGRCRWEAQRGSLTRWTRPADVLCRATWGSSEGFGSCVMCPCYTHAHKVMIIST